MNNKILLSLINTGVSEGQPEYVQNKIKLANKIALFLAVMASIYAIVIWFTLPEVFWIEVFFAIFICAGTLVANYAKLDVVARIILSVAPQSAIAIFHGILLQENDHVLVAFT